MRLRRANSTKMLKTRLPKTARAITEPSLLQIPRYALTMRQQFVTSHLLLLAIQLLLAHQCQSYQMQHEPVASNEINLQHQQPVVVNSSRLRSSRDVTNLRLIPELRSIKLRWDYEKTAIGKENDDNDWPASFRIRFCELTSWQAEIKCRQRDMQVQQRVNDAHPPPASTPDEVNAAAQQQLAPHDNSTVIQYGQQRRPQAELVRVIAASDTPPFKTRQHFPASRTYEAQIFDLRALTSYTFNVQVLRFMGDTSSSSGEVEEPALLAAGTRPARRLDLDTPTTTTTSQQVSDLKHQQAPSVRVETKPFIAEALKCLANSSEVLVNTGRYFGGRISVEGGGGPVAPACQLLGNKSSAQSSYLFRIDHELCRSKVLDSQRIETMILVHENKDLLTHNTARFHIQCNISQRSFTVRASVSLPKVNGLTTTTGGGGEAAKFRPATVTAVASPNQRGGTGTGSEEQVRLGSMPGVFRLIRANQNSLLESESQHLPSTAGSELDGRPPRANPRPVGAGRRESKELHTQQVAQALVLPRPVDVSSGILFVNRKHDDSAAHAVREARLLAPASELVERVNTAAAGLEPLQQQQPIVMTNNHRVAGDFLPLAQAVANLERAKSAKSDATGDPFSIKYSPESVSEYSLARMKTSRDSSESLRATDTPTPLSVRSRSGRMRQISDQQNSTSVASPATTTTTNPGQSSRVESRMGEARQAAASNSDSMSAAESSPIENRVALATSGRSNHTLAAATSGGSAAQPSVAATNPTLAQNITGALLRWSLKTLGNLARKSLDALASETELAAAAANRSKSDTTTTSEVADANEEEEPGGGRSAEPEGAIIGLHEGELDGFMVERRKTTEKPVVVSGQTKTATTASVQQQQVRAATQSADLRDSRKPHQLAAPPGNAAVAAQRHPGTATPAVSPTTGRPTQTPRHRSHVDHQTRARLEPQQHQTEPDAGRSKFSQDDASLLPSSEDPGAPPSPSQANTSRTSSSSLWPIYCLWSLVGLLGLVTLVAFLLVSNRGARGAATSGSFHPGSHHHNRHNLSGGGGILAQLNDAIHRHHTATMEGTRGREMPPPGLPAREEVYVHTAKQQGGGRLIVQSPSVQRRDLTSPGSGSDERSRQRQAFANVSHALAMSPGGSSAACTRSTSAASTANMSSSGLQELGSGSANIVFSDSCSSGANSVSPDPNQRRPTHESYCKNHEQIVYTDYLLLSDSDCLTNDCRGESFA